MGSVSKAIDREMKLLVQFLKVAAHHVPQLDVLEVVPTAFIPRVPIGGIARQRLQPDLAARARHEVLDLHPPVDRRPIPDDQQSLACHAHQMDQELDAVQPVE